MLCNSAIKRKFPFIFQHYNEGNIIHFERSFKNDLENIINDSIVQGNKASIPFYMVAKNTYFSFFNSASNFLIAPVSSAIFHFMFLYF